MNDTSLCPEIYSGNLSGVDNLVCIDGMFPADAEVYQIVRWWLDGVIQIIICAIGFLTNLVSIRVLLSREMKNLFNITLAILAIFDAIYTFCDITESLRTMDYNRKHCTEPPLYQWLLTITMPHVLRPLRYISMVASIYTTIIISMERYVAVSKPIYSFVGHFEGAQGKWKSALMYTLPAALFSIMFSLPKFFEFSVESADYLCDKDDNIIHILDGTTPKDFLLLAQKDCLDIREIYHINATSFRLNKDYSLYYVNISQNIVTGLIPLVSLVILNYLVYKHLKERRKGIFDLGVQTQAANHNSLEIRQAQTFFGVVALFFIGHTLRIFLNLHEITLLHGDQENTDGCKLRLWNQVLHSLSRVLCAISHSGNIIIYCLSSASFRMVLCNKLLFKKQDPFELSHLQSPYDKHYNGPSREDTVCISFLQSSRHNSTVSQLNNLHSVNLQSPRSENIPSSSRQLMERKNMFLDNCHKLFQCKPKENERHIPIDDMTNLGNGIELQPSNANI